MNVNDPEASFEVWQYRHQELMRKSARQELIDSLAGESLVSRVFRTSREALANSLRRLGAQGNSPDHREPAGA